MGCLAHGFIEDRRWSFARALRSGVIVAIALVAESVSSGAVAGASSEAAFVFTSDVHYGLHRGKFRDAANVESRTVGAAMVDAINALPSAVLPEDGGVNAGRPVGPVEFVAITGDITNRQELLPLRIQSASVSWAQFEETFIRRLALRNRSGQPAPLMLMPGNHDVSNAIGSPTKLVPERDATTLAEIYNRMLQPAEPRTKESYRYATDKILYSRNVGGAHCIFLTVWPDSVARAWMETDLKRVPAGTPVFLFAHDPPKVDARHFTNPNNARDINSRDKFENILADIYAGGVASDGPTTIEQRALATFLKAHRNIVAYFHGHNNWNEFYTWKGPDGDLALNVFRADSPMKGRESGKDETKLSFQVAAFDVTAGKLTSRECLWNSGGARGSSASMKWGRSITISLHGEKREP